MTRILNNSASVDVSDHTDSEPEVAGKKLAVKTPIIIATNSHQPVRRRERKQQKFNSPGSAQHFLSVHAATQKPFNHQRNLLRRPVFKELRADSFTTWTDASASL